MPPADWLSSGGSYILIAIIWLGSAIGFAWIGLSAGKATRSENDGCLLAIGNVVLALFGGGLGFLLAIRYYPWFIFSSMAGSLLLPTLATAAFLRRAKRG